MCVIAHTAKKKYMPRANVEQCMKSNPSGFFMCELLPGSPRRRSLRTMNVKDALEFFDSVDPEHGFVLHARIPSFGSTGIDNVHGWEVDGIMFCHNMSMRDLDAQMKADKWDKTDSEYFFRFVFIPVYRAFGKEAYKDGKFCEYIDRLVRIFAGSTNRFLFIMPDNTVIKYGNGWVTDFNGNCDFSNSSYRIWNTGSWNTGFGHVLRPNVPTAPGGCDDDADDYEQWCSATGTYGNKGRKAFDGSVLFDGLGPAALSMMALKDVVLRNVYDTRMYCSDRKSSNDRAEIALQEAYPAVFDENTTESAVKLVKFMAGDDRPDDRLAELLRGYASGVETAYGTFTKRTFGVYPSDVDDISSEMDEGVETMCSLLSLGINDEAEDAASLATAFTMERTKKGGFKMVRMDSIDVLCPDDLSKEEAMKGITNLLKYIRAKEKEAGDGDAESGGTESVSSDPEKAEAKK